MRGLFLFFYLVACCCVVTGDRSIEPLSESAMPTLSKLRSRILNLKTDQLDGSLLSLDSEDKLQAEVHLGLPTPQTLVAFSTDMTTGFEGIISQCSDLQLTAVRNTFNTNWNWAGQNRGNQGWIHIFDYMFDTEKHSVDRLVRLSNALQVVTQPNGALHGQLNAHGLHIQELLAPLIALMNGSPTVEGHMLRGVAYPSNTGVTNRAAGVPHNGPAITHVNAAGACHMMHQLAIEVTDALMLLRTTLQAYPGVGPSCAYTCQHVLRKQGAIPEAYVGPCQRTLGNLPLLTPLPPTGTGRSQDQNEGVFISSVANQPWHFAAQQDGVQVVYSNNRISSFIPGKYQTALLKDQEELAAQTADVGNQDVVAGKVLWAPTSGWSHLPLAGQQAKWILTLRIGGAGWAYVAQAAANRLVLPLGHPNVLAAVAAAKTSRAFACTL